MGVAIKFRKGTAAEHASFAGLAAEVTVQTGTSGNPWSLRVHDGLGGSGHHVPATTDVATLTNKTITDVVLTGTIKDNAGNTLGTISNGKLVMSAGAITLNAPNVIDETGTVALETIISRIARKNQMILGD
jgi:hypothetical protein